MQCIMRPTTTPTYTLTPSFNSVDRAALDAQLAEAAQKRAAEAEQERYSDKLPKPLHTHPTRPSSTTGYIPRC